MVQISGMADSLLRSSTPPEGRRHGGGSRPATVADVLRSSTPPEGRRHLTGAPARSGG